MFDSGDSSSYSSTSGGPGSEGQGQAPFMGKKERRASSASKHPIGDSMHLKDNSAVQKLLSKTGDKEVLFSDELVKVNKRLKTQKRIILITDLAIYNLIPDSYKMKRRITLDSLGQISLSCLSDNFFSLQVPSEYDYLMASNRKCEIVQVISDAYKKLKNRDLVINFSNCFDYRIDNKVMREIKFTSIDGGVSTQIVTKKG